MAERRRRITHGRLFPRRSRGCPPLQVCLLSPTLFFSGGKEMKQTGLLQLSKRQSNTQAAVGGIGPTAAGRTAESAGFAYLDALIALMYLNMAARS